MAIHCAAAESGRGVLIKKKENKESSWVKLKAFDILCRAAQKQPNGER